MSHTALSKCVPALIVFAALLSFSGPPSAVQAVGRDDPQQTQRTEDTTTLTQEVVDGVLKLRDEGPSAFPQVYGGIATGDHGDDDVLVVYLTALDSETEHAIVDFAGVPSHKVRFEHAVMTRLEAESLDEQARALAERFGSGIRVSRLPAESVLTSRADDRAQRYGGDFLNSTRTASGVTSYNYCTDGFPLTNQAHNKFILTAGHCYITGERIYNGIPPSYGYGGWNSNLVGAVYTRTYNTGYPDAGLIAADGSRGMWTGSSDSPTGPVTIDALIDPWPGMPLCIDGAYEGEVCSLHVVNPDHNVCIGRSPCFPHQSTFDGWTDQALGNGDSGAPLYASIEGTTYGIGIASSTAGSLAGVCRSWTAFNRICTSGVNAQNIGSILTQWGLSLDPEETS